MSINAITRRFAEFGLSGRETNGYQCLVMDLDHATRIAKPASPENDGSTHDNGIAEETGSHHRVVRHLRSVFLTTRLTQSSKGTPMFMALDLLEVEREYSRDDFRYINDAAWFSTLMANSRDPDEAIARAFSPDAARAHGYHDAKHLNLYDETWLREKLAALLQHFDTTTFGGRSRKSSATRSNGNRLRHDIESCFWGMCPYWFVPACH